MGPILLDTHAVAFLMIEDESLSPRARRAIETADIVLVSPVSLYEIGLKVRLGKWPDMEPVIDRIMDKLHEQGTVIAPLNADICLAAGRMDWAHRDPFDRLIAATAQHLGVPVITKDRALAGMAGIECIW
jgi:PIN domain nuclease of toxin-antitoxin system